MQIEERMVGDVVVVKVTGDITLNQGSDIVLKDKVNSLLQQGRKKILLDLGGVAYVDSAGLGQLVQVKVTTGRNDASLKLLNITSNPLVAPTMEIAMGGSAAIIRYLNMFVKARSTYVSHP